MYQVGIENIVGKEKLVIIAPGQEYLEEDGSVMLDDLGDPIINDTGKNEVISVAKSTEEIQDEESTALSDKTEEIQQKIDDYVAARGYQLANGGPGPVADVEIMKIVNEHNGQFEVIFKENQ
jgi:hypothetical protein